MLGRQGTAARRSRRGVLAVLACLGLGLVAAPAASAAVKTYTDRVGPISVEGYEVLQTVAFAPHAKLDGKITNMEVDVVDADGTPVPIDRLMLHHIVFANLDRDDNTCSSYIGWDSRPNSLLASERFYAAGEERAKMALPPGYGYELESSDTWGLLYMFMNHRATRDEAYIQYKYRVASGADEPPNAAKPYWMDVENCKADPIYNVPGTKKPGSRDKHSMDLVMPESGRIVGGAGHVHGGAYKLKLTEPECGNRKVGESVPTWGKPKHPFYNVKPVLHEPGPISMSGFQTKTGIPVAKGERVRLTSVYDNSLPHVRVMGIMIMYVDPDKSVTGRCGPLPNDVKTLLGDVPGRKGPIRYKIPLTGLNKQGEAVTISKPPGKLKRLPSGKTIKVKDRFFARPNLRVKRGRTVKWRFDSNELHNVTLANGPRGFGSENLNDDRTFTRRFTRNGKYRLFCAIHPVQMTERIVVRGKRKRGGS